MRGRIKSKNKLTLERKGTRGEQGLLDKRGWMDGARCVCVCVRAREREREEGRNNEITLQLADPGGLLE